MKCDRCGKEIVKEEEYRHGGKKLCPDCRMHAGLFPLGHTGMYKKEFYIKDRKRQD